MARTPTTPIQAQQRTREHCAKVAQAAAQIQDLLDGRDALPDAERTEAIHAAAKIMEAAGCYVRRANADRLLTP